MEQIDYIALKDSASQISKISTFLSDIFKQFNKELHDNRAEFKKKGFKVQREMLLAQ